MSVAPLVFRAPEGPAAREARRPHFVRRRASKPARALRSLRRPPHRRCLWLRCARAPTPPTGAAARPRLAACPCPLSLRRPPHRRRRIADVCSARRLVVRPGPATAHGRRSQALPPSTGTAARPCHRPRVPQPGPASKPGHALRSLRRPSRRRCLWFWCTRAPKPMGAQTGSGERNIAPAWCSSSWNGASLKQKPPTHAHNRRKLAYLGVLGRIIFHGVPQQLMHGRFFFQSGPACGHRCQQLLPDRGCRGRRLYVDLPC